MIWTAEQTRDAAHRRMEKEKQRTRELEARRAEGRAQADELARLIGERDGTVRRIWGFGSVFDHRLPFRESSDLDLAAEGGGVIAWKLSQQSTWDVDWVELAEQPESFVRTIQETGVLLYERQ